MPRWGGRTRSAATAALLTTRCSADRDMRLFYTPTADGDRSGRVGRIAGRRRVALRVGLQRALPVQASAADELAHPDRGGPEDRDVAELRARDGQVVAPRRFRLDA